LFPTRFCLQCWSFSIAFIYNHTKNILIYQERITTFIKIRRVFLIPHDIFLSNNCHFTLRKKWSTFLATILGRTKGWFHIPKRIKWPKKFHKYKLDFKTKEVFYISYMIQRQQEVNKNLKEIGKFFYAKNKLQRLKDKEDNN
jgi:hypothetical protein